MDWCFWFNSDFDGRLEMCWSIDYFLWEICSSGNVKRFFASVSVENKNFLALVGFGSQLAWLVAV